jgi:FkbM family methyltransferase
MFKRLIKNSIKSLVRSTSRTLPYLPGGEYAFQQLLETGMDEQRIVQHKDVRMAFATPNALCRYRAESFSTKEPDTLKWVDEIPANAILWDIGANVGLYSIYAAKARDCRVFAFEPSVFNLELLARNIHLNEVQQKIVIVPVALSDGIGPSLFRMSSTAWGGALSTFGQDFDQHGETLRSVFEYQTMGLTMTDAHGLLKIPLPQYIKIDVDGIEHFILRGGADVLKEVESVLIEINDDFADQAEESSRLLREAGLTLLRKCNIEAGNQYNQWWVRHERA